MPWNFPLWQVVRFAAPALMAGNVGLLKHASNVPQSALYLSDVSPAAGFPEGAFPDAAHFVERRRAHPARPRVAAATLTGSEPAGQSVAAICGDEIKHTVLELGGSDPFIVMPSADLDEPSRPRSPRAGQNNGQSCIAAKRFIVHDRHLRHLRRRFVEKMEALKVGDPLTRTPTWVRWPPSRAATTSPSRSTAPSRRAPRSVAAATRLGPAGVVLSADGGDRDHQRTCALYTEEVFGPVASMYRASGIDEAIEIANATTFGLGSNAWTNDEGEQQRFIDDIEAGQVFINGMTVSYPELPLRRHQALGLRPRARGPRHPRVLQRQDRLGGLAVLTMDVGDGVAW